MISSSEKQVVLLPKNSVTDGFDSRNGLLDLLERAGYDKIRKGFDRRDQLEQGDFRFRRVKGAGALAVQLELYRGRSLGVLMGSDVLAEADLLVKTKGIESRIERLGRLNIGRCWLCLLSPKEQPVIDKDDLNNRIIFSKFPLFAARCLKKQRIKGSSVRATEGADSQLRDWCELRPSEKAAAIEIVGSGETLRALNLRANFGGLLPYGDQIGLPYLLLPSISTDVFISNADRICQKSREALSALGRDLKSAIQVEAEVSGAVISVQIDVSQYTDPFLLMRLGGDSRVIMKKKTNSFADWDSIRSDWYENVSPPAFLCEVGDGAGVNVLIEVYAGKGMSIEQVGEVITIGGKKYAAYSKSGISEQQKTDLRSWMKNMNEENSF